MSPKMFFQRRAFDVFAVAVMMSMLHFDSAFAEETIDEIVVTADFRGRTTSELPASISVLDSEMIEQAAVQHFEELVFVIPNFNWSGDGNRARYFQIRGVGELEQYQGDGKARLAPRRKSATTPGVRPQMRYTGRHHSHLQRRSNGATLQMTELVDGFYKEVQDLGGNRWDTSSLIARLEK